MLVMSIGFAATLFVVIGALALRTFRWPELAGSAAAIALGLVAGIAPSSSARAAEFRVEGPDVVEHDNSGTLAETVEAARAALYPERAMR